MLEASALSDKVNIAQDKVVTDLNRVNSGSEDMINFDEFSGIVLIQLID